MQVIDSCLWHNDDEQKWQHEARQLQTVACNWLVHYPLYSVNVGRLFCDRKISAKELQAVSKFLGFFITCDLSKWPTETLLHPFWMQFEHRILEPYSSCMKTKNFTQLNCHRFTAPYCGSRSVGRICNKLIHIMQLYLPILVHLTLLSLSPIIFVQHNRANELNLLIVIGYILGAIIEV